MFEKGIDDEKIMEFLKQKIKNAELKQKLTIIDPYFFANSIFSFDTEIITTNILKSFPELIILEVVTQKSYNKTNYEEFKSIMSNVEIQIFSNDDFHDRFWIVDDSKGFIVGTSINGFGKKHFFIQDDYLSNTDVQKLLTLYRD